MRATMERLGSNKVAFEVEIDSAQFEKAVDAAYRRLVQKVNVPGFRKGKAPRKILELHVGKGALYEDALDRLVPDAYRQAVLEHDVEPVENPKIDILDLEDGEPVKFKAEVSVKPEVSLGEYKGLAADKLVEAVTNEDVNKVIEDFRIRRTEIVPADHDEARFGDLIVIDFQGYIDGEPFKGGAASGHLLELGSGQFIPGFEDQLVGTKAGNRKDVEVTFPEEYGAEELAGKAATFQVVVHEIKSKQAPELNDEFTKEISDFATLEELRAGIKKNLQQRADQQAEVELHDKLVEAASTNATADLPDVMVERRTETLVREFASNLAHRGVDVEKYLQATQTTAQQLWERFRPQAADQVKAELVLEAIAKAEGLVVTDDELNARIDEIARHEEESHGRKDVRAAFEDPDRVDALRRSMVTEKAVEFLVEAAHVEVKEKPKEDAPAQEGAVSPAKGRRKSTRAEKGEASE